MKKTKCFLILSIFAIFRLTKTDSPSSKLQAMLVYDTIQSDHNILHNGRYHAADTDIKNLSNDANNVQDDLNLKLFRIEVARLCKKTGKCYCKGNVCNFYKNMDFEDIKSELIKLVQRTSDRICRTTGRCGCIGNRCGDNLIRSNTAVKVESLFDELDYNDVSDVVDKINNQLTNNIPNTFGISGSDTKSLRNDEVDRLCRKTGRCGCTGTRCGDFSSNIRSHTLLQQLGLSSQSKGNKQLLSHLYGTDADTRDNDQPNETGKFLDNINKYLRNEEKNRLCNEAGRCGCTGNRCGDGYYRTNQISPDEAKNLDHQINNLLQDFEEYQNYKRSEITNLHKDYKLQSEPSNAIDNDGANGVAQLLDSINKYLRNEEENRLCIEADRCGCTGNRCGDDYYRTIQISPDEAEKKVSKYIDHEIDNLLQDFKEYQDEKRSEITSLHKDNKIHKEAGNARDNDQPDGTAQLLDNIYKYLRNVEENRLCMKSGGCGCTDDICSDDDSNGDSNVNINGDGNSNNSNQKSPDKDEKQKSKNFINTIDSLLQQLFKKYKNHLSNSFNINKTQKEAVRCGCTSTRYGNQSRFKVKKENKLRKRKQKETTKTVKKDHLLDTLTKKLSENYKKIILGLFKSLKKPLRIKSYQLHKENVELDLNKNLRADINEIQQTILEHKKQRNALHGTTYLDKVKNVDRSTYLKDPRILDLENHDIRQLRTNKNPAPKSHKNQIYVLV